MKTNRIVLKAVAAAVLAVSAGVASAGQATATVQSTITIQSICKFSGTVSLAFGSVDPSLVAADLTATGTPSYNCTKGVTPTSVAMSATSGNMTSGANTIAYTLNDISAAVPVAGDGFGAGTAKSLPTLTATVLQADAQNAQAGSYSGSITLTLNY